jgi:hypothetical protein
VSEEPIARQLGNGLKRPGFFEQVGCSRNHLETALAPGQLTLGGLVKPEDDGVAAPDD